MNSSEYSWLQLDSTFILTDLNRRFEQMTTDDHQPLSTIRQMSWRRHTGRGLTLSPPALLLERLSRSWVEGRVEGRV